MMLLCIKQHQTTFVAQFMKQLSNAEAELKKSATYKKKSVYCKSCYNSEKEFSNFK